MGNFGGGPIGAVSAVSFAWHGYYDVVLAYLALSFPANRLEGRASRVAVGALLALFLGRPVDPWAALTSSHGTVLAEA